MKILTTNENGIKSATSTKRIKIMSVGTFLPEEVVYSDDLFEEIKSYEQYNIPTNWLSNKVGIHERRVGRSNALPSDHCLPAASEALANLPESVTKDIGLVIFCGIERDQGNSTTADKIQSKLGLNATHSFDIANACFGFVEAIVVAGSFIALGTTKYALIVTGEISTQVMKKAVENLKQGMEIRSAKNIIGALTVGDAGGAMVVGLSEEGEETGFHVVNKLVDSNHIDKCIYRRDAEGVVQGQMLMGQITNQIIRKHRVLMPVTMGELGWDSADWVVSHQMGEPPFEKVKSLAQAKDSQMIKTFPLLGNITTATFSHNYSALLRSDAASKNTKVLGFFAGSGLAIGQFGYCL